MRTRGRVKTGRQFTKAKREAMLVLGVGFTLISGNLKHDRASQANTTATLLLDSFNVRTMHYPLSPVPAPRKLRSLTLAARLIGLRPAVLGGDPADTDAAAGAPFG